MSDVTEDDKIVWEMPSGSHLACIEEIMDDQGKGRHFTAGLQYRVQSMHPIAIPAYVQVINNFGQPLPFNGSQLRIHFKRGSLLHPAL